jgi:hypothetical protein
VVPYSDPVVAVEVVRLADDTVAVVTVVEVCLRLFDEES